MDARLPAVAMAFLTALLALAPQAAEAACFLSCRCSDRSGYGTSRSYGPFDSTMACNAAVSNFTMQCKSGNQAHWFTASCSPGCFNCEPPAPPKRDAAKAETPAAAPQPNWDDYRKNEQAKEQRQFQLEMGRLKQEIKGGEAGSGELKLKAPPSDSALRQLKCADEQSRSGKTEEHGKDLVRSSTCDISLPEAPPVPAPTAAESKGRIPQAALDLQQRLTATRQKLARQDKEIVQMERVVQAEEAKKPQLKTDPPSGDSAALLKARAALAKAQADRARTAAELGRLEKQEAAGPGGGK